MYCQRVMQAQSSRAQRYAAAYDGSRHSGYPSSLTRTPSLSYASLGSSLLVLGRFDSQEQLIPLMMFARGAGPPTWEGPIQQNHVRDQVHLHPSPVRKWAAADTTDLIPEKLNRTVVNTIIVRFDDSLLLLINKLDQAPLLDCRSE